MPSDKLILADSTRDMQRATGLLHGIEVEGWPIKADHQMELWSTGWNLMTFWAHHVRTPSLNYAKHHWHIGNDPDAAPPGRHRLLFAAMCLTDAAIAHNTPPIGWGKKRMGLDTELPLWDAMQGGELRTLGWLGTPLGPTRHLYDQAPDLLAGTGMDRLQPLPGCRLEPQSDGTLLLQPRPDVPPAALGVLLPLPEQTGRHLVLTASLASHPIPGFDPCMARTWDAQLMLPNPAGADNPETPWIPAPRRERRLRHWGFLHHATHPLRLYLADPPAGPTSLRLTFETAAPVRLGRFVARTQPPALVRLYQHGAILANPSVEPVRFDPTRLFPGRTFRHLTAGPYGDTETHTGRPVTGPVEIPAKEALFLLTNP